MHEDNFQFSTPPGIFGELDGVQSEPQVHAGKSPWLKVDDLPFFSVWLINCGKFFVKFHFTLGFHIRYAYIHTCFYRSQGRLKKRYLVSELTHTHPYFRGVNKGGRTETKITVGWLSLNSA